MHIGLGRKNQILVYPLVLCIVTTKMIEVLNKARKGGVNIHVND